MKLRYASGLALLVCLASAAAAASCAAQSANNTFTTGSGGSGGAGTSTTLNGGGGGFAFLDAGPLDAAPDQHTGPTDCDSSCATAGGVCMSGTCVISDNPGNIDPATQTQLNAGGSGDPAFAWLYPYDRTVFPRGLVPPTLQFAGAAPDAVYVRVSFPGMEYQGFYGPSNPGHVVFSPAVWTAITSTATGLDEVKVEITKVSGGAVAGPLTQTWTIAQGSLRGTIYYETYDSPLAGGLGSVGIMKLQPGAAAPTVIKSGCGNVCHTASADGSTMVAATGLLSSASYDLKNNVATILDAPGIQFTYGGIYPDGSVVMSATHYRTWLFNASQLYDVKTGTVIPAPGWDNVVKNGGTPSFSPDGKKMVFNHEDTGAGRTLAVMDFDYATKTFSNLVEVASHPALTLAWPAFTPDGSWIVYHAGTNQQFETDNGALGDLYFTSATSSTPGRLDALDGYQQGSSVYLPAKDANLSFAPTVLPEAVGGYYWVVFTSHRSYGNTLPSMDGPSGSPGEYGKLWVAAFDMNPTPGQDPSHPAFFLDGQEAHADNLRGFWVLDPCRANGESCTSGDQCCEGFCRPSGDGGALACVPPPTGCSNEYEKCTTASDCCDPGSVCINGHCGKPPPK